MRLSTDLVRRIRGLEEALLRPGVRSRRERIDALLTEDFVEFGSSGRILLKSDILDSLPVEETTHFEVSDFECRRLGPEAILATYRVERRRSAGRDASLRSSLWVKRSGRWKMLFHQGTTIR